MLTVNEGKEEGYVKMNLYIGLYSMWSPQVINISSIEKMGEVYRTNYTLNFCTHIPHGKQSKELFPGEKFGEDHVIATSITLS